MNESVLNRICDGGNASSLLCEDDDGLPLARGVDLDRFMGDWYVIAAIPTPLERGIENAVETYRRRDDGWIDTTFRYSRGARERSWQFKGKVLDACNAVWGMQLVWPLLADYRILYVDDAYRQTVIGRRKRDYAWIMARAPELGHSDLFERVRLLRECGYDTARLRRMVHRPRAAVGAAAAD